MCNLQYFAKFTHQFHAITWFGTHTRGTGVGIDYNVISVINKLSTTGNSAAVGFIPPERDSIPVLMSNILSHLLSSHR